MSSLQRFGGQVQHAISQVTGDNFLDVPDVDIADPDMARDDDELTTLLEQRLDSWTQVVDTVVEEEVAAGLAFVEARRAAPREPRVRVRERGGRGSKRERRQRTRKGRRSVLAERGCGGIAWDRSRGGEKGARRSTRSDRKSVV